MTTLTLALVFSVSFLLMGGHAGAQGGATQQSPSDPIKALEREKLQLEIEDLKSKTSLPNQPIVLTVLTPGIGGLLFSILTDKRAKKSKQLDKTIELVDEVAADLNAVFTPLFRYIRIGHDEDQRSSADLLPHQLIVFFRLHEDIKRSISENFLLMIRSFQLICYRIDRLSCLNCIRTYQSYLQKG